MYLIELLLPLYTNDGKRIGEAVFQAVRTELTERFGGLTAHSQAPVEGLWKEQPDHTQHDELVIFEVMAQTLDRTWWSTYRKTLEERFAQEVILIRAAQIEQL